MVRAERARGCSWPPLDACAQAQPQASPSPFTPACTTTFYTYSSTCTPEQVRLAGLRALSLRGGGDSEGDSAGVSEQHGAAIAALQVRLLPEPAPQPQPRP